MESNLTPGPPARRPMWSVIVPTRDRPALLRFALESLRKQSFPDFEVIVSDNPVVQPCRQVFEELADDRFRYVRPPRPLGMSDHWEFALGHARGEYVTVLADRKILCPAALHAASEVVCREKPDMLSWWRERYVPDDVQKGFEPGTVRCRYFPRPPQDYSPQEHLRKIYGASPSQLGFSRFRGMIFGGAYSKALIDRIRSRLGRLFFPLAPDVTSRFAALSNASKAMDMGRALMLTTRRVASGGRDVGKYPSEALRFLKEADPTGAILDELPIPGLFASSGNIVARDYLFLKNLMSPEMDGLPFDIRKVLIKARDNLRSVRWPDPTTKTEQWRIWRQAVRRLPVSDQLAVALGSVGYAVWRPLSRALSRIRMGLTYGGRGWWTFHGGFLEAAAAMDQANLTALCPRPVSRAS